MSLPYKIFFVDICQKLNILHPIGISANVLVTSAFFCQSRLHMYLMGSVGLCCIPHLLERQLTGAVLNEIGISANVLVTSAFFCQSRLHMYLMGSVGLCCIPHLLERQLNGAVLNVLICM